jgi:hypothetical protein
LEEQCAELRAVLTVLLPMAAGLNMLAGVDFSSTAER